MEFLGSQVLLDKIAMPMQPSRVIRRQRVIDVLGGLVSEHRVVTVCAAAGAGKTTAVVQTVHESALSVVWLTLDESERSPGRFLIYLASALDRQVSECRDTIGEALRQGASHSEAAGLLAQSIGLRKLIVVFDELEHLSCGPSKAWTVLAAFIRHAPDTVRIILVSRRALPEAVLPAFPEMATVQYRDLDFTESEAISALSEQGIATSVARDAIASIGGWVTGVLFEAWTINRNRNDPGADFDPLFGYLGAHLVGGLAEADRDFIITTSIAREISVARARALGFQDAHQRLASVRHCHLPAVWNAADQTLRHHTRFREYLQSRFEQRDSTEVRRIRVLWGKRLIAEGHHEEAVEHLVTAGEMDIACRAMEVAIVPVIERFDLPAAQHWLDSLDPEHLRSSVILAEAQLMISWASEDYRETARTADLLVADGRLDRVIASSGRAAALVGWTYYMRGRISAAAEVLNRSCGGDEVEAVRLLIAGGDRRKVFTQLTGGPFDLFALFADYFSGSLSKIRYSARSTWSVGVGVAQRVAVLRATGQTMAAIDLYRKAVTERDHTLGMLTFMGPDLFIDACELDEAREVVADARARFMAMGADGWAAALSLAEAKLELRLANDPDAAIRVLNSIDRSPFVTGWLFRSAVDAWYGLALLKQENDVDAQRRLERAVGLMTENLGHIDLPAAAVYLSEARFRCGDSVGSTSAASTAMSAAVDQGSNHLILQALNDMPSVLRRCVSAEATRFSRWHSLGRSTLTTLAGTRSLASCVVIMEFGEFELLVNRSAVTPALTKSAELMAFLATTERMSVSREGILDALFDGRSDESAKAYLRQAIHQLRVVLPADTVLSDRKRVWLNADAVSSESGSLLIGLTELNRLNGHAKLEHCSTLLDPLDGKYLPGFEAEWVESRREKILRDIADARMEVAHEAFLIGRFAECRAYCESVLAGDQYRDLAWLLLIEVSATCCDFDGLLSVYRRYRRVLDELGLEPSAEIRERIQRIGC
ncbi:BTAD domain-containing putative transcriptional regulator [Nocardia jiangxiensis]|uniref:BTAD domain-containing putative transcriptional regulator n=1 Tax=Nocardia jiangxiensis TaxID=282685 RepID=UPI0002D60ACC|nr:BTAD domain-containing putative transcriptional regulator [Nocardia jiangxiensis]